MNEEINIDITNSTVNVSGKIPMDLFSIIDNDNKFGNEFEKLNQALIELDAEYYFGYKPEHIILTPQKFDFADIIVVDSTRNEIYLISVKTRNSTLRDTFSNTDFKYFFSALKMPSVSKYISTDGRNKTKIYPALISNSYEIDDNLNKYPFIRYQSVYLKPSKESFYCECHKKNGEVIFKTKNVTDAMSKKSRSFAVNNVTAFMNNFMGNAETLERFINLFPYDTHDIEVIKQNPKKYSRVYKEIINFKSKKKEALESQLDKDKVNTFSSYLGKIVNRNRADSEKEITDFEERKTRIKKLISDEWDKIPSFEFDIDPKIKELKEEIEKFTTNLWKVDDIDYSSASKIMTILADLMKQYMSNRISNFIGYLNEISENRLLDKNKAKETISSIVVKFVKFVVKNIEELRGMLSLAVNTFKNLNNILNMIMNERKLYLNILHDIILEVEKQNKKRLIK